MPDFEKFIASIARELSNRGLPYTLIGGQAVLLHGEPRATEDVDITLGADPGRLPDLLGLCSTLGLRPLVEDVERFVQSTFVLPALDASSSMRVDFIFSSTPYEQQAIQRSVTVELAGVSVKFATAEDLILHKLFAGRSRDVEDVNGVVRRKGADLDWAYLDHWAQEFSVVEGKEDLPTLVRELRANVSSGEGQEEE